MCRATDTPHIPVHIGERTGADLLGSIRLGKARLCVPPTSSRHLRDTPVVASGSWTGAIRSHRLLDQVDNTSPYPSSIQSDRSAGGLDVGCRFRTNSIGEHACDGDARFVTDALGSAGQP